MSLNETPSQQPSKACSRFTFRYGERASSLLEEVWALYCRNKSTLGFLPRGAFEEFFSSGGAVVALEGVRVCGYALWRTVQGGRRVRLVHLCVDQELRGQNLAQQLLEQTIERTASAEVISLTCRKDYVAANALWPKAGFVFSGEKPGRGQDAHPLYLWKIEKAPPLIAQLQTEAVPRRYTVALDANVFFDLLDPASTRDESRALLEDWLEECELCITSETLNEVARGEVSEDRQKALSFARRFRQISGEREDWSGLLSRLNDILGQPQRVSDQSDRRQLAHALGGEATHFVTRDCALLRRAQQIEQDLGLVVESPTDFIVRVQRETSPTYYAPASLRGTAIQRQRVTSVGQLLPFAHRDDPSDRPWKARVRSLLAQPKRYSTEVILSEDGKALAATSVDMSHPKNGVLAEFLRCADDNRTAVIVRRLVAEMLELALRKTSGPVRVRGPVSHEVHWILLDMGFRKDGEWYLRPCRRGLIERHELELQADYTYLVEDLTECKPEVLERRVWPLKLVGAGIPCYVVPIKPQWAEALFDEELARESLFHVATGPALSLENVYYCLSKARVEPGARLLWYVSGRRPNRVGEVRAASRCVACMVGPGHELFREGRRYGVYEWKQIEKLISGSKSGELQAIRFEQVEPFQKPVNYKAFAGVLKAATGKQNTIQSIVKIPESVFIQIYKMGISLLE